MSNAQAVGLQSDTEARRRPSDARSLGSRAKVRLVDSLIRKLPAPAAGNVITYDEEVRGFGIRVTANGVRAFILNYVFEGRERRLTVGRWPDWNATTAREHAKLLRRRIDTGEDPLAERQARREAATFREIAEAYLAGHAVKKKSGQRDREYLERDVYPTWGAWKALDIKRRDVISLVERKARSGPIAANRLLAVIRKLFNWAIERDLLEANPCLHVKAPAAEAERDRVLSEAEIRKFWRKLDTRPPKDPRAPRLEMSPEIRVILKLLVVTAARPGEVAGMARAEIESSKRGKGTWWTIPAERSKNGLAHRVWLTKLARELVGESESPYVFPSRRGNKPIAVNALSHALRLNAKYLGIPNLRPHDLRRSAASLMASLDIPQFTIDRILNHVEPKLTRTYNRHGYDSQKKAALEKWERKLRQIIGKSEKAQVVEMPA